jgi:hypothetical protein
MTASPPIPPVDLEAPPLCERLEEMASNRQEIADSMRSWEPKPGLTPRLIAKADGEAATLREAVQQIEALRAEGAELKRDEAVWEKKCDDDHAMIDRLTKERGRLRATQPRRGRPRRPPRPYPGSDRQCRLIPASTKTASARIGRRGR